MSSPDRLLAGTHVLLAGESWVTHAAHAKGAVSYAMAAYEEGADALIEALMSAGAEVTYVPNHLAVERFPRTPEELAPFDVVILSDIGSDTLLLERACFLDGVRVPNRLESLVAHIETGAGLLMVGGYMSFSGMEGKAHYRMTPLAQVLPVEMLVGDDRIETPQGVVPTVLTHAHEILTNLDEHWPYLLGYNKLLAKDAAEVLLSVNNDPLLVVQHTRGGRTAAFASDCSPHWGSREFLAWPSYAHFWTQLVHWLAGGRDG
jgi:uncharacterized membrane protein